MISTVTTTTVTTITSVALAASLGALATVALLLLLIQKEILSTATSRRAQALHRALNLAILPLLINFLFTAAIKVSQVLP